MKAPYIVTILAAIFLASCQMPMPPRAASSLLPNTAKNHTIIVRLEKKATLQFKDPDSVKFKGVQLFKMAAGGTYRICGQANAKNSYGGYGGFRTFFYDEAADLSLQETDDEQEYRPGAFWNLNCN
jgi:hypothetical protein